MKPIFIIFIASLSFSNLFADSTDEIRRAFEGVENLIKTKQQENAQTELETLHQKYGHLAEFEMFNEKYNELKALVSQTPPSSTLIRLDFKSILVSGSNPGKYPNLERQCALTSKIEIDPNKPLQDTINEWLENNKHKLGFNILPSDRVILNRIYCYFSSFSQYQAIDTMVNSSIYNQTYNQTDLSNLPMARDAYISVSIED